MGEALRGDQVRGLLRLVQEAARIGPDPQARRRHLLLGVLRLVGGDTAGLVDFADAPTSADAGRNLLTTGLAEAEGEALSAQRAHAIEHAIYAVSEGDGAAVGVAFSRAAGRDPFSEEDRNLVRVFAGECHALLRGHADPLGARLAALPRRVREVHGWVLRGAAAKDIAARMGIGLHTTHQYLKVLYRAFGVSGRAELLSLWLHAR